MRLIKTYETAEKKAKTVNAKRRNPLEKCLEKRESKKMRKPTLFEGKLIEFS